MARRSARLQKRSPTPSINSRSSWETAASNVSPDADTETDAECLPPVVEGSEPVAMKTPQKPAERAVEKPQPASQLPQLSSAVTPLKSKSSMSMLAAWAARTPKNHTPIKPAGPEMHPAHHHASTAKVLDEARWLGFQALGAHTAPPKATSTGIGPATPSKTSVPTSTSKINTMQSPEFGFRFRSPIPGLSPRSNRILNEGHEEDAVAGGRTIFGADEFSAPADVSPQRKTAVPKGKMARFSDVHMAQFKKMDSIANHPSAFRADPNRFKPVNMSLKRSPSKADLEKPEPTIKGPNKLKRTQSKIDVAEVAEKAPASTLKRTESKTDVPDATTKIRLTPWKRTQSDMAPPSTNIPRAQSTVKLVPPTRDGRPPTQDGNPAAKRFKRIETDDAASTRPLSRDSKAETGKPATPRRPLYSQRGLPRLTSRLLTPTKASLARSQSVKTLKTTSMMPPLLHSPSYHSLFSPNIGQTMKEGMREGIRKTSNSLHKVRSILRTPGRKYSDDPEKVAAGTHMSPPPGLDLDKALPNIPATAPVKKHVLFSTSTLERATQEELGNSPSPMKFRASSEVPSGAVIYPTFQAGVEYPALPNGDESPVTSRSRRLTFGGATANTQGQQFSFKSNKPISFGPASTGTIRMVRKSDASSLVDGKKRKVGNWEESSDKENNESAEDQARSAKKIKTNPVEPPKTPTSTSKLPRRTPKRGSALSKSRLALLSTPKRGMA